MARDRPYLFAMNGGMVSKLALGRTDLARMKLTAEVFQNAFPRVIGPMKFRGGLGYLGGAKDNGVTRCLPFIFSVDDTAMIELGNNVLRVLISNTPISRVAVATTVTNGDFASATGWTLTVTSGGVANINSTVAGALVLQTPVRGGTAKCERTVSVAGGDVGKEHAMRVVVTQGAVNMRLGSTSGGQELFTEQTLNEGTHSLVFTPTGASVFLQLNGKSEAVIAVDSCQIEAAGELTLPTPWLTADLFSVRSTQSADVIFVANSLYSPMRIERRGNTRSWSIVKYKFIDGPFKGKTANINLTPSVRLGNGILTASAPFFSAKHVGTIFEITHTQSVVNVTVGGPDQYSDSVRISGKNEGTSRNITRATSGTWSGTISGEVSYDDEVSWQVYESTATNYGTGTFQPGSDNEIVHYRLGFQSGDYTSGTAAVSISTPGGGGTGVIRITGYTDSTHVTYEVLSRLHYTGSTENWQEGKYSDFQGWPSSVGLFEGRLFWGSKDQLAGSGSDDFTNFSLDTTGDAAPIIRSVSNGPVNKVQWILGLGRLLIGTSGAETALRASSFDEPLTPSNNTLKDVSTFGSADIQALKVDKVGIFTQRTKKRLYEVAFSAADGDYISNELTRYNPTVLNAGVKIMTVQRQPDTRIWLVLNDGTVGCLVYEKSEDVVAWCTFVTDGLIQDIAVLPNTSADDVFMTVQRTINGVTQYYRELLAYEENAMGGTENYMADCYVIKDIVATTAITGLAHLEGKSVVVWAAGSPVQDASGAILTFVVIGGVIALPTAVTGRCIVGLSYTGQWQSTKLAYAAQSGSAVSQKKIVKKVAPVMVDTHIRGVTFGPDFNSLASIPRIIDGKDATLDNVFSEYDNESFDIMAKWANDARLCIQMRAPYPSTVLGLLMEIESHERA